MRPAIRTIAVLLGVAGAIVALCAMAWRIHTTEITLLDTQNRLALADSTRVVYQDSTTTVTERLAESRSGVVQLKGVVGQLAKEGKETGVALQRLRIAFDSIKTTTTGRVSVDPADPTTRLLQADLDTGLVQASIVATVPPPPGTGMVHWTIRFDTTEVITTLTRTPSGQAIFRAAIDSGAKVIADSVVVAKEKGKPRLLGIKLPGVGGSLLVAVPALVLGWLAGR